MTRADRDWVESTFLPQQSYGFIMFPITGFVGNENTLICNGQSESKRFLDLLQLYGNLTLITGATSMSIYVLKFVILTIALLEVLQNLWSRETTVACTI